MYQVKKISAIWMAITAVFFMGCGPEFDAELSEQTFIKFYGSAFDNEAIDVVENGSGGFYILGNEASNDVGTYILVIKTDQYGNRLTQNTIGEGDEDFEETAKSMVLTNEGNLIILGEKLDEFGLINLVVYHYDVENSTMIWEKWITF